MFWYVCVCVCTLCLCVCVGGGGGVGVSVGVRVCGCVRLRVRVCAHVCVLPAPPSHLLNFANVIGCLRRRRFDKALQLHRSC